jgi:hypothetical protein
MSDKIVTKCPGVSFKDVHPTPSAGKTLHVEGADCKFVRCKQCGFIVNREINDRGSGYGNETSIPIITIAGRVANARDPIVTAGCPLCGSSEYE